MIATLLKNDLKEINHIFPKLRFKIVRETLHFFGGIDITDIKGNYWDTFDILIIVPRTYPNGVPIVIETSKKLPRHIDRHIDCNGVCCLDMPHELQYEARYGLTIFKFLTKYVYPYFANQLYYNATGQYSNGEYGHEFDGVIQFYSRRLSINNPAIAIRFLQFVLSNQFIERNSLCPCGSDKKVKKCHLEAIQFLKALDRDLLESDLRDFKRIPLTTS